MTLPWLMMAALAGTAQASDTAAAARMYRAHGTEPFWSIQIENGHVSFDGTEVPRFSEPVSPRALVNGQTSRYTSQRVILIVIAGAECSNGMSEETYPDTTIAIVDGEVYANGCGGEALPAVGSH